MLVSKVFWCGVVGLSLWSLITNASTNSSLIFNTLSVSEYSLTSEPQPLAMEVIALTPWQVWANVRFPNVCLADAGLAARYLELDNITPKTKLLRLMQLPNPKGCPEIWRPVSRYFIIEIPNSQELEKLVVLDWSQGGANANEVLQFVTLTRQLSQNKRQGIPIQASLLFSNRILPKVDNIKIVVSKCSNHLCRYHITFTVYHPPRCDNTKTKIYTQILETRTGVSDRMGLPVVNWLFVLIPHYSTCDSSTSQSFKHEYSLNLNFMKTYSHQLVIVNPALNQLRNQLETFFRIYSLPSNES